MATYISKQSGLWSSASTWLTAAAGTFTPTANAGVPPQSGAGDRFIIRGGNVVEYDVIGEFGDDGSFFTNSDSSFLSNAICLSGTGSTLKCARNITTSLSCRGSIVVGYNSIFDWGTSDNPVTANSEIVLGTQSSTLATSISSLRGRCGIFNRQGVGSNAVTMTICGNSKTRSCFLSGNHVINTTSLTATDVTGWNIGDRVLIEPHTLNSISFPNMNIVPNVRITNINGNIVTIDTPLTYAYPSGSSIGNYSSNITLRPGVLFTDGSNAFPIRLELGSSLNSKYSFKNFSIENLINNGNDNSNASMVTFGALYADIGGALINFEFDNMSFYSSTTWGGSIFSMLNKSGGNPHEYKNIAAAFANNSAGGNITYFRFGPAARFNNLNVHRTANGFGCDQTNTDILEVRNSRINFYVAGHTSNFSINRYNAINTTYRYISDFLPFQFASAFNLKDCTLLYGGSLVPGVAKYLIGNGTGSWINSTFTNCNLASVYLPDPPTLNNPNVLSKESYINLYTLNGNPIDNRRFNSFYSLSSSYTNRNRGLASYKIRASIPNNPFTISETIDGFTNEQKRFIGYIKYDSSYGSQNLPFIKFSDSDGTVTQTFSCDPIPDVWQKFDKILTPQSTGKITITFTGQTSITSANVYLDGLAFYPITPKARHYGFIFDDSLSYRTIDSKLTLTENQVSSYPAVFNLNNLYDEASYWSVVNPTLTSYIDITIPNGKILDAGSNNIVLNNTYSTNFEYLSATKTLTLKTLSLSSTTNFDTVKTTGNVYLSGSSYLTNMTLDGNVFVNTPQNLQNTNITNIRYNSDTVIGITYKNCIVDNVQNSGSGTLTITLDNSTVNSSSGNVTLLVNPTILDIKNLNGGYISIFDDLGVLQYYQNSNGLISLPSGSTGTWSYKIGRYNYKTIEGTFSVNPLNGITITIDPVYIFDSFVSETNVSITSAYSVFNDLQKVYDYLSYFRTTSAGLSGIPSSDLYAYRNVLDVASNNIVFNPSASNKFLYNYENKTLTLSSQKMTEGTIVKGLETAGNLYLSGTHSLSGMYATIGGGIYVQTPYDVYNFNLLNSGVIRYNVNTTPISLVYTNSNIYDVVNDGDATITITRINSIVNENDAEIITTVPIRIDINVSNDTYWAIYRPNGTRYQYGNGTTSLILGGNAVTGTWSYRITRYGYISQSSTFSIDKDVSSTTTITPTLLVDTALTESDVATVSAYTDLESTRKIYDYNSYYGTTSSGIDKNIFMTKGIGSISLNGFAVELDKTATSIFDFQTSPSNKLIIKCSSLNETIDFYCGGDFIQSNGNTISKDVHIRSNNLDSEIEFIGINKTTFYPTSADRDGDTNRGPIVTDLIYRFKLGNVYSGVTFAGDLYLRADVGGIILQTFTLKNTPGYNVLNLGTFGQIQQVLLSQQVINNGVKKASRLIPHSQNI